MKKIEMFVDGSCLGNPGPGGYGIVVLADEKIFYRGRRSSNTTNNQMELTAAIEALNCIKNKDYQVTITTDSQYVKNGITEWIHNWKKNNWKLSSNKDVKNRDLWEKLDKLNFKIKPKWVWVRGHVGHKYNELANLVAQGKEIEGIKF